MSAAVFHVDQSTLNSSRGKSCRTSFQMDANLVVTKGQALALVTGASVNHKQTITATSGSAGSAVFDYNGERFTLPYNCSAAAAQALIAALPNVGTGNVAVTGTTLDAGALTVEWKGKLAGLTQNLIVLVSNGITGATPAIATSQTPVPNNRLVAWNPARIADPAIGTFTVAGNGSGSSFGAGTYFVQFAWRNAQGSTLPTIAAAVTITAAQNLRVSALNAASTPDDALYLDVYVNGVRIHSITVSTPGTGGTVAQTDIAAPQAGSGQPLPTANTAFVATDGRHYFTCYAERTFCTDNFGKIFYGTKPISTIGAPGKPEGDVIIGGTFFDGDLLGIDGYEQLFLDQVRGRLVAGVLGNATAEYFFGPEGQ
ncbi:MAG: hypothetical protein K1X67_08025 [Fimbriimonadaceae bacterium]|nr:hypothetical protein [Fimbriimonadaceae bacterium]